MTAWEKSEIKNLPTIGYWSALGGVEIKRIEPGIEDYVVCISQAWYGTPIYHRVRVRYTHSKDSRTYIEIDGTRLYLDQCLRTGA